jgi:hypothetical protein
VGFVSDLHGRGRHLPVEYGDGAPPAEQSKGGFKAMTDRKPAVLLPFMHQLFVAGPLCRGRQDA